jgi:hypothetical protein
MAIIIARIIYLASLLYSDKKARLIAVPILLLLAAWASNRGAAFAFRSLPAEMQERLPIARKLGLANPPTAPDALSFNQASLLMLNDFFPANHHTVVAMGDRAGGLAYWGRHKVSVVQAEGLTLDIGYIKARLGNTGEEYLARMPIEYWIVDREIFPTVKLPDGQLQYAVPEPIQGRVTEEPVPTFCFPASAIRYRKSYPSASGVNTRIAFEFSQRMSCAPEALQIVRTAERGEGLRQYSLPTEYDPKQGGTMDQRGEDRDRHYVRE